jgi:hypothetical protein
MNKKFYVSIKGPDGGLLMNKVEIISLDGSPTRNTARDLRVPAANPAGFARGVHMHPARLAWAVFAGVNDEKPVTISDNWNPKGG